MRVTKEMFLVRLMENIVKQKELSGWVNNTLQNYGSLLKDIKRNPHNLLIHWAVLKETCRDLKVNTNYLKRISKQL